MTSLTLRIVICNTGMIIVCTSYNPVCCEALAACKQALNKQCWLSRFTPMTLLYREPMGLAIAGGNGETGRSLAVDTHITAGPPTPQQHKAPNCAVRKPTLWVCFHLLLTRQVHGRARRKMNKIPGPQGWKNEVHVAGKFKIRSQQ